MKTDNNHHSGRRQEPYSEQHCNQVSVNRRSDSRFQDRYRNSKSLKNRCLQSISVLPFRSHNTSAKRMFWKWMAFLTLYRRDRSYEEAFLPHQRYPSDRGWCHSFREYQGSFLTPNMSWHICHGTWTVHSARRTCRSPDRTQDPIPLFLMYTTDLSQRLS